MTVQVIATGAVSFMVAPVQAQLPERAKANQRQMALNAKVKTPPANKPHVITDKTRDNKAYVMLKNVDFELLLFGYRHTANPMDRARLGQG